MRATIRKWGNSVALRIPSEIAKAGGFGDGTEVEIELKDGRLVIEPVASPDLSLDHLLAAMTLENLHREQHAGDAHGSESW